MSDFPDRLTEMARYYMKPRTLVEVEVKDAEEQQVRGTVILQLKEVKNPKTHCRERCTSWPARRCPLLIGQPCTLICAIKSPAKSYGYFHVGKFRLLPVSGALRLSYGKNEVVSVFSDHLQDIMNEAMIKGPEAEAEEDPLHPGSDREGHQCMGRSPRNTIFWWRCLVDTQGNYSGVVLSR